MIIFFCKQKTAYEMRISDWSSDVCSSDLSVFNEGEGIEREHIPRLTERFYRADSRRSRRLGGTGLGLAIAKHIINRHRGVLEIESRPNEGATFSVYLPAAAEKPAPVATPAAS